MNTPLYSTSFTIEAQNSLQHFEVQRLSFNSPQEGKRVSTQVSPGKLVKFPHHNQHQIQNAPEPNKRSHIRGSLLPVRF